MFFFGKEKGVVRICNKYVSLLTHVCRSAGVQHFFHGQVVKALYRDNLRPVSRPIIGLEHVEIKTLNVDIEKFYLSFSR